MDDHTQQIRQLPNAIAGQMEHEAWNGDVLVRLEDVLAIFGQRLNPNDPIGPDPTRSRILQAEADWLDLAASNAPDHGYTHHQIQGFKWAAGWVRFHADRPTVDTSEAIDAIEVD